MVFRKWPRAGFPLWGPILLGALLSFALEMTQLYVPGRDSSLNDLAVNIGGAAIGVVLGVFLESWARTAVFRHPLSVPGDRAAFLLLFITFTARLFPFLPLFGLYQPKLKLLRFVASPVFDPVAVLSAVASWYVVGRLLSTAGIARPARWLAVALLSFPLQIILRQQQPTRSALLGSLIGIAAFTALAQTRPVARWEGWAFLFLLVLRGLTPFTLSAPQPFHWVPFAGSLGADWQGGVVILLEKASYYGAAVWLLRTSGMRYRSSAIVVAAVLAGIEVAQIRLPGRTPEVTDPIMAILIGFGLAMLPRSYALMKLPGRGPDQTSHVGRSLQNSEDH